MKFLIKFSALALITSFSSCSSEPKESKDEKSGATVEEKGSAASAIDFSWREHEGDFPKDKPGYLILVTEDALAWSRVLPEFVAHKEKLGFKVYVATEKDYASGKVGNEQAYHLRAWLREFQKRTGAKYALFVGDSSPSSANLPAPTRPDGERTGMDEGYRDLDGKCGDHPGDWVDAYLRQLPANQAPPRSAANTADELMVGRVSYLGNEIGNGAYDLDRILAKFMRYENETLAGKGLDWRGRAITVTSNYGGSGWDVGLMAALEKAGSAFEHYSTSWNSADPNAPIFSMIPENFSGPYGAEELTGEMNFATRKHGLMSNMSHGANRGSEGIIGQGEIFRDMDDRFPSVVGVTACTAFHPADNCNMGHAHLRRDAVFAIGTSHSGNNGFRAVLLEKLVTDRLTVGETMQKHCRYGTGIIWYGDPSLRIVPAAGEPICSMQVNPTLGSHYDERTLNISEPMRPFEKTYTVTNNTQSPMTVAVASTVSWLDLSHTSIALEPGKSAKLTVRGNATLASMEAGTHTAAIRFSNPQTGDTDERRIKLALRPVTLVSYHGFDANAATPDTAPTMFADLVLGDYPGSITANAGNIGLPPAPAPNPAAPAQKPAMSWLAIGGGRGALRLDQPAHGITVVAGEYLSWRGVSASFVFNLDALPAPQTRVAILKSPFLLEVDDKGALLLSRDGAAVSVGTITPGAWMKVLVRSDLEKGKIRASLEGGAEIACDFPANRSLGDRFIFGSFTGMLDEVKIWSGELSDRDRAIALEDAVKGVALAKFIPASQSNRSVGTRLEWRPINQPAKVSYRVFLGESETAVASATPETTGIYQVVTVVPRINAPLGAGKTFYWRVDTQTDAKVIPGRVQSFRTLAAPFTIVRPSAECSAAANPAPHFDPHRGQLLRSPAVFDFALPDGTDASKVYLQFKGFCYPWYDYPAFTVYRLDGVPAGPLKPEDWNKAVKTKVATGKFNRSGNRVDVTGFLTPGKSERFAIEGAPGSNLNIFSDASPEPLGFFFENNVNWAIPPKLVVYTKDAPPSIAAEVLPKIVTLTPEATSVDLGAMLLKSAADLPVSFSLANAPEWLQITEDGKLSLRPGVDFYGLDFGGYNTVLTLKVAGGGTYEQPLKIAIPVPEVRIKLERRGDGTVAISPAAGPLAKGVIRYTTDGSPVKADSPVYKEPFLAEQGMKVSARFFYLDRYPYAAVGFESEIGVSRAKWKTTEVSGNPATLNNAPLVFDGRNDTCWGVAAPTGLPQVFAWDLGEETNVSSLAVQNHMRSSDGRTKDYVLHGSKDGKTWERIAAGTFSDTPVPQRLVLAKAQNIRFLRLEATSLHAGNAMAISEIEVFTK